jgi:hypothetical protein
MTKNTENQSHQPNFDPNIIRPSITDDLDTSKRVDLSQGFVTIDLGTIDRIGLAAIAVASNRLGDFLLSKGESYGGMRHQIQCDNDSRADTLDVSLIFYWVDSEGVPSPKELWGVPSEAQDAFEVFLNMGEEGLDKLYRTRDPTSVPRLEVSVNQSINEVKKMKESSRRKDNSLMRKQANTQSTS